MSDPNKVTEEVVYRGSKEELLKYLIEKYNILPNIPSDQFVVGNCYEPSTTSGPLPIKDQLDKLWQNEYDRGQPPRSEVVGKVFFMKPLHYHMPNPETGEYGVLGVSFEVVFVCIKPKMIWNGNEWVYED